MSFMFLSKKWQSVNNERANYPQALCDTMNPCRFFFVSAVRNYLSLLGKNHVTPCNMLNKGILLSMLLIQNISLQRYMHNMYEYMCFFPGF